MSLIKFEKVSLDFGDQKILTKADLSIEEGEYVCLIGRNGSGKSTTFKLIKDNISCDQGKIIRKKHLLISQLNQSLPDPTNIKVFDFVKGGLKNLESLITQYKEITQKTSYPNQVKDLEELHKRIDARGGWNLNQYVEKIISDLELPKKQRMKQLSGGWRRRAALARALVQKPDLLLLDEPTNHLDIATITWLESMIRKHSTTILFITHDRHFLRNLATRIIEIDRGKLISWPGSYDTFQKMKLKAIKIEKETNQEFDKKLAQEEIWIRKGIKARRTRNEGRVRAIKEMREIRSTRINREKDAVINIQEGIISGRKVIRIKNLSYSFKENHIIKDFSINIMRGDKIAIIGNNGVGKTTLLRLLTKILTPDIGTIKHGSNLEIGYFDPLDNILDEEKSVAYNVGNGQTYININGKDRHIIGYLKGFLFSPKRAQTKVKVLSGGERNRIMLAKLFTKPLNLLILDEPTNDLDIETLAVLEETLKEYKGTLIIASHDREFIDNVVTSSIVFESDGKISTNVGGFSDWQKKGKDLNEIDSLEIQKKSISFNTNDSSDRLIKKLNYKEQTELKTLPKK